MPAALTRGKIFAPRIYRIKVKKQYTGQKRHEQALENSGHFSSFQFERRSKDFAEHRGSRGLAVF
jgi:hypothetical protein